MTNTDNVIKKEKISLPSVLIFTGSILIQILGVSLWPLTKGFTKVLPTIIVCVAQIIGLWLFNRVIVSGVELSLLVPFAAATFPLVLVLIGIFIYKEKASLLKIFTLIGACVLIAVANFL
jgi:small multidrug resistance pump